MLPSQLSSNAAATTRLHGLLQGLLVDVFKPPPAGFRSLSEESEVAAIVRARQLLKEGADPVGCGAASDEPIAFPFLATAAEIGSVGLVRLLLEAGADSNQVSTTTGDTPLHLARTPGTVRLLVSAGARLETLNAPLGDGYYGTTPLHGAVIEGDLARVKAFLAAGASPNAVSTDAEPVLHSALFAGTDIFQALLGAGADPDALDRHDRDAGDRLRESSFLGKADREERLAMLASARLSRGLAGASPSGHARPRF